MTRTASGSSPRSSPSRRSSSMEARNAASVLPEPVGAAIRAGSPASRRAARPWAAARGGHPLPLRRSALPTSGGGSDGSLREASGLESQRSGKFLPAIIAASRGQGPATGGWRLASLFDLEAGLPHDLPPFFRVGLELRHERL